MRRISSIGNGAGSRSSASSRVPARAFGGCCRRRPTARSGRSVRMSLPMTSRDVARGSIRENTRSKKSGVAEAGPDAVRALLERDESHDEPSGVSLTSTQRLARPRTRSGYPTRRMSRCRPASGSSAIAITKVGAALRRYGRAAPGSRKCSTTATSGPGAADLGVPLVEHGSVARPGGEPAHAVAVGLAAPRERARHHARTHRAHAQAGTLGVADLTRSRSHGPGA